MESYCLFRRPMDSLQYNLGLIRAVQEKSRYIHDTILRTFRALKPFLHPQSSTIHHFCTSTTSVHTSMFISLSDPPWTTSDSRSLSLTSLTIHAAHILKQFGTVLRTGSRKILDLAPHSRSAAFRMPPFPYLPESRRNQGELLMSLGGQPQVP